MKISIVVISWLITLGCITDLACADDFPLYRSYPRVYGPTHRLYGPTQAAYQYHRQYGHPSNNSDYYSRYFNNYYPHTVSHLSNYTPFYYGYSNYRYVSPGYTNFGFTSANYFPYRGYYPAGRFSSYIPLIGYSGFSYYPRYNNFNYFAPNRYGYPMGWGINRQLPFSPLYGSSLYHSSLIYASPLCYSNNYSGYDLNNLGINYPLVGQSYSLNVTQGTMNYETVISPVISYPVVDPVVHEVLRQHETGRLEALQPKPVEVVVRKNATKSTTEEKIRSLNYQTLGDTYLREGNYPKAILKYEIAQAAAGDRPEPYFHQAIAQLGQREYTSALQSIRNGLEINPDWIHQGETLTSIFGEKNPDSVRMMTSQLANWVQLNPNDKSRLELQGFVLLLENNQELAQKYFDVASQLGGMQGPLASLMNSKSSVAVLSKPMEMKSDQIVNQQSPPSLTQEQLGRFPALGHEVKTHEVKISEPVIPPSLIENSGQNLPDELMSPNLPTAELPRFPAEDSPLTDPPPQ